MAAPTSDTPGNGTQVSGFTEAAADREQVRSIESPDRPIFSNSSSAADAVPGDRQAAVRLQRPRRQRSVVAKSFALVTGTFHQRCR